MPHPLGRQRIIVTGASRGIGRGIATELARRGHLVGMVARSEDQLQEVCAEIAEFGGLACCFAADLTEPDRAAQAVDSLADHIGGLDAVVNNAGRVSRQPFFELTPEAWESLFATNVHSMYYVLRAAVPLLVETGGGHIVNFSSISGRLPLEGGSAYAATKYAVTGLSESLFLELRDLAIKVTTIFPGSVRTESRPSADDSWKVTPAEVGLAVAQVLETGAQNLISALEIRPLSKKLKRNSNRGDRKGGHDSAD